MAEKKIPPVPPSLAGERVYLRPTTAEDIGACHHWRLQSEPQAQSAFPVRVKSVAEAVEDFKKAGSSEYIEQFTAVRVSDKMPVGLLSYFDYNSLNRSAALGLLIDPEERRSGYGTEAIKLLIRYLFSHRGVNKVHTQTDEANKAAIKLLEGLGFKKDATLRDHYFRDGEFRAGVIYSLLRYELDW